MKNLEQPKNASNFEQYKFLSILFAPTFLLFNENHLKLALNAKVWLKCRNNFARKPVLLILNLLLLSLLLLVTLRLMVSRHFQLGLFVYVAFLILQLPLARLFLLHKFNQTNSKSQIGVLDPSTMNAFRKTKFTQSCEFAEQSYLHTSKRNDLPNNFIGKRVEPTAQNISIFGEPKVHPSELESVLDKDLALFPLNETSPDHHIVIGQTGSGKTTLISRMIDSALKQNWRVVLLDLKGDPSDVNKILSLSEDQSKVRHFPSSAYDFWQGTKEEIAERVISFIPSDTEPFYLNRNSNAIRSVIVRTKNQPPTSVEDFITRIRNGSKLAENSVDLNFFANMERGLTTGEIIANDLIAYLDPIRDIERRTPYRFHWRENWQLAIFTLDGFEPGSLRIADAVLHDFASWIFSDDRAMNKTPILLVIDEASAFSALPKMPILSALIQRARSARVSLVYASQNLSAFKDEKDNLLHSGAIRWLGSSTEVEEMVEAAGTNSVVESGFQMEGDKYTGVISHRSQKEFKIDPDYVKELRTFHWFVSARGKVSSVFVPPINWQR